jgi:hypothetical protein
MSEHFSTVQMRHFSARTLPVAEMTALAEHLTSCVTCQKQFQLTHRASKADALLFFTLAPEVLLRHEHLQYEQLAHYLDGGLDVEERELIHLHLSACEQCREDVQSLREFRQQIAPEMSVSYAPAERDSKLRVIRPVAGWFGWLRPAYAAAAVAVLLVALVAVLSLSDRRTDEQQAQALQPTGESKVASSDKSPVSAPPITANDNIASAENVSQANNNSGNTNSAVEATPRIAPSQVQARASIQRIKKSPSASTATLAEINDGDQKIIVDVARNVTGLNHLKPADTQIIKETLLAQNITKPSELSELVGNQGVLRGNATAGETFKLLSPARIVTANDRPTFRWEALPRATSYRVYVGDADNKEVADSGELSATAAEWTPSAPLPRGKVFTWVVIAKADGNDVISPAASQPEARFKVLSGEALRELDALQNGPRSHLAMGITYARLGMLDEAEREFKILVRQNPNSPFALRLLRSVQSWR